MTARTRSIVGVLLLGFFACGNPAWGGDTIASASPAQPDSAVGVFKAELINASGETIGQITAQEGAMGVLLQIRATGLPPGFHGLHLHAVGDCSDPGPFKRAGGHIKHADHSHGFLHTAGVHRGDLPNLYAHTDGVASADLFATELELSDLRDADGAALIIHAEPDNYRAQPIGAAGARIACAAFDGETTVAMEKPSEVDHE